MASFPYIRGSFSITPRVEFGIGAAALVVAHALTAARQSVPKDQVAISQLSTTLDVLHGLERACVNGRERHLS